MLANVLKFRFGKTRRSKLFDLSTARNFTVRIQKIGLLIPDQWFAWPLWAGSLALLAVISRLSYLYIERPARFAIRKRLRFGH